MTDYLTDGFNTPTLFIRVTPHFGGLDFGRRSGVVAFDSTYINSHLFHAAFTLQLFVPNFISMAVVYMVDGIND